MTQDSAFTLYSFSPVFTKKDYIHNVHAAFPWLEPVQLYRTLAATRSGLR